MLGNLLNLVNLRWLRPLLRALLNHRWLRRALCARLEASEAESGTQPHQNDVAMIP